MNTNVGFDAHYWASQRRPKTAYVTESDPRAAFVDEMRSYGFEVSGMPTIGKLERLPAPGDKKGKKNGWCIYNEIPDDYRPGEFIGIGVFGDWKGTIDRVVWASKRRESMSTVETQRFDEQLAAEKIARENAIKERRAQAAERAKQIWSEATEAPPEHPYLTAKGVQPHGVKVSRGNIVVPVTDNGDITSLQFIDIQGGKKFLGGGKIAGGACQIGETVVGEQVYVAEGWATAATIHEATGSICYAAFNAGNLTNVVRWVKAKHEDAVLVICGDDDRWTDGNPGRAKATAAANATESKLVFPEFGDLDDKPTDFNDMAHQIGGLDAVRAVLIDGAMHVDLFDGEPLDILSNFKPREFPAVILPPVLRDYVYEQSDLIGSDPAILAVSCLVVCAAAIDDTLKLQPKQYDPTYTESARLCGAIIGDPSTRKTPSINKAMGPVKSMQAQWAKDDAPLLAEYETELKVFKKQEAAYTTEKAKTPDVDIAAPKPPEKPCRRRSYVEDITVEALSDVLAENCRGILIYADELSGFFSSFGAYNPGKAGKDRAHYLELWNGGPRQIDRVTRGSIHVPNWSGCILGGIQPEPMRKIASKVEDDGLLQRFLPVICRPAKMEIDRRPNMEAINGYKELIEALYRYEPPTAPIKLDAGAQEIRRKFLEFTKRAGVLSALSPKLGAHIGKYGGIFERLLLVFHVVESLGAGVYTPETISEQTAAVVSDLMRKFFFSHATAFYLDILGDTPDHTAARSVAGYILASKSTEITNRSLQGNVRPMRDLEQRERLRVMDILTVSSWVAPIESNKPNGPTKWRVNPRVHDLFKDRAEQERKERDAKKEAIAATVRELNVDNVDGNIGL